MTRSRLLTGMYLLGRKRAERRAQAERDALAAEFEEINCATNAELKSLRADIGRMHRLDGVEVERDQTHWLH